jgi:hypothetical protein
MTHRHPPNFRNVSGVQRADESGPNDGHTVVYHLSGTH